MHELDGNERQLVTATNRSGMNALLFDQPEEETPEIVSD